MQDLQIAYIHSNPNAVGSKDARLMLGRCDWTLQLVFFGFMGLCKDPPMPQDPWKGYTGFCTGYSYIHQPEPQAVVEETGLYIGFCSQGLSEIRL